MLWHGTKALSSFGGVVDEPATEMVSDEHQTPEHTLDTMLLGIFNARMPVRMCM